MMPGTLPTPAEIAQMTREIRATWDRHRWARSTVYHPAEWLPPGVDNASVTLIPSEWYRRNEPEDE